MIARRRVALSGMNNPHGPHPRMALWPDPPGCAGHRLWQLTAARTGASAMDYARAFHRYNLVQRGDFSRNAARDRWHLIEPELLSEFDTLVLLGVEVSQAIGLDIPLLTITPSMILLPHPSGRNRWYNDPVNRTVVEILMEELYTEATVGYSDGAAGVSL